MRFRIKAGGPAARFTFDRTPKPYGRYYGKARSWEDILKNKNSD